jgi:hypothetical protein
MPRLLWGDVQGHVGLRCCVIVAGAVDVCNQRPLLCQYVWELQWTVTTHQQQLVFAMQLDHLFRYFRQEDLSDVILKIKLHAIKQEPEDEEQPASEARQACRRVSRNCWRPTSLRQVMTGCRAI